MSRAPPADIHGAPHGAGEVEDGATGRAFGVLGHADQEVRPVEPQRPPVEPRDGGQPELVVVPVPGPVRRAVRPGAARSRGRHDRGGPSHRQESSAVDGLGHRGGSRTGSSRPGCSQTTSIATAPRFRAPGARREVPRHGPDRGHNDVGGPFARRRLLRPIRAGSARADAADGRGLPAVAGRPRPWRTPFLAKGRVRDYDRGSRPRPGNPAIRFGGLS